MKNKIICTFLLVLSLMFSVQSVSFAFEVNSILDEVVRAQTFFSGKNTDADGVVIKKLEKGRTLDLKRAMFPYSKNTESVEWTVSDSTIARIDDNGILTAEDIGIVTVVARCDGMESKIKVEVISMTHLAIFAASCCTLIVISFCVLLRKHFKEQQ